MKKKRAKENFKEYNNQKPMTPLLENMMRTSKKDKESNRHKISLNKGLLRNCGLNLK